MCPTIIQLCKWGGNFEGIIKAKPTWHSTSDHPRKYKPQTSKILNAFNSCTHSVNLMKGGGQ